MSDKAPKVIAIADANIWVAERLFQSTIGVAFLYAISSSASIVLSPEIVELEIGTVLPELAERAVSNLRRDISLLKDLSGHDIGRLMVPTSRAIKEGIDSRLEGLAGMLDRVPFTFEQARAALDRILRKAPPAGMNNEQFRDCCIWQTTLEAAKQDGARVHLISNDSGFYEGRNRTNGMAADLLKEARAAAGAISLHSSVEDFLSAIGVQRKIDESTIAEGIVAAARKEVPAIALRDGFADAVITIQHAGPAKIIAYATPKPSIIAVAFEIPFKLDRTQEEVRQEITVVLDGVGSYNPDSKEVSDIEIRGWQERGPGNISRSTFHLDRDKSRRFDPTRIRFI
jgi:hypothetical protein